EVVGADLAMDGQTFGLGPFNFGNRFLGRYMDDVNWATCISGIVEIRPGMSRFRECRRAFIPRAHVGASCIHQTLLQDAGNLPIFTMEQRDRGSPQLGYGIESRVNTTVVKRVCGPR